MTPEELLAAIVAAYEEGDDAELRAAIRDARNFLNGDTTS